MSICRWIVLFLLLPLAGCGSSVEGVYSGTENSWLERIDLRDEQRVELTFMGTTKEGTYEVEKDRVRINNGGDISILRIDDDGCLDGGEENTAKTAVPVAQVPAHPAVPNGAPIRNLQAASMPSVRSEMK